MDKCKCGRDKYVSHNKCKLCMIEMQINLAIPNISEDEMEKLKEVIQEAMADAWYEGVGHIKSKIYSRI